MSSAQITDPPGLEAALASPGFLLFKHSKACPISHGAFAAYGAFLDERPDLPTGWIDVIRDRPLSREVERRTGVGHASPQALLLVEGRAVWAATHGAITQASLREAVAVL